MKRCTIQITVSCIAWSISLLNMLMFLFFYQAQVSWFEWDLSKGKRKLFPDLGVIATNYFAATQFCKLGIFVWRVLPPLLWKGFSISLLRCTGCLKAQLWSRKGENIPWDIPVRFSLCKAGWHRTTNGQERILQWSRAPVFTLMNPAGSREWGSLHFGLLRQKQINTLQWIFQVFDHSIILQASLNPIP